MFVVACLIAGCVGHGTARDGAADTTLDALITMVLHGDTAARAALQPIASRLIEDSQRNSRDAPLDSLAAQVALAMAAPISPPEASRTGREALWRAPAVLALRQLLASDSGNSWSAEQLEAITPYPYIWLAPARELTQLRALTARSAVLPTSLETTRIRLEIEVGSIDSADVALERIDTASLSPAQRDHLIAEIAFARGDTALGRTAYYRGAATIQDSADRRAYTEDLIWIAKPAELTAWDSIPMVPAAHRVWLEHFWARRDLDDGQLPGTRLPEQFRRWREALHDYRWDHAGDVALGTPDLGFAEEDGIWAGEGVQVLFGTNAVSRWRARSRILDDRGFLVMQHGDPIHLSLPPGRSSVTEENLAWAAPGGELVVGFSRTDSASERFGMVARNVPMGDPMTSCAFDGRLCNLQQYMQQPFQPPVPKVDPTGTRPLPPSLRMVVDHFASERQLAETTDGNPTTFVNALGAIIQTFGIPDRGVLLVVAVPAGRLEGSAAARTFDADLRVIIGDSAAGSIVAAFDTVRHWHSASAVAPNEWLSAYFTVPAPTGTWDVAITVSDTAKTKGTGVRLDAIPVVPFDGKTLRLSDPILGRGDAGLIWHHDGVAVPLNPTNAWHTTEPIELTVEADGLVPGRSYGTRFELWEVAGHQKTPSITVAFTAKADSVHEVFQRELSVRELDPGDYRLVIRLQDPVTKQEVTRERRVAVRR